MICSGMLSKPGAGQERPQAGTQTLQEGPLPGKTHHRRQTNRVLTASTELLNTGRKLFPFLLFFFFLTYVQIFNKGRGRTRRWAPSPSLPAAAAAGGRWQQHWPGGH